MKTKTCPDCGETFTAWTDAKRYCGGLRCDKAPRPIGGEMRIVGLRQGNWRRSALDIEPPKAGA